MASKTAVVVGSLGVIGRNLLDHLAKDDDWDLVGLSRRAPDFETRAKFISVDLLDLAAWPFADYGFGCHWDVMTDTLKLRRAGFHDCVDSEAAFRALFQKFRDMKVIP